MNDEFITKALQNNRYLKAVQLINRFETELRKELELIGDHFVAENRELFVDDAEAEWNHRRSSSGNLAFARVDYVMDRVEAEDADPRNLKLNISFRWVEPANVGQREGYDVLTVLSYKIKYANEDEHRRVKEQTRQDDWDVRFADDAYDNSPGIIYCPVETAQDLEAAHETLLAHFSTYGGNYGTTPGSSHGEDP